MELGGVEGAGKTRPGEVEECFQVEKEPGSRDWNQRVKSEWRRREGRCHQGPSVIVQCCHKGPG